MNSLQLYYKMAQDGVSYIAGLVTAEVFKIKIETSNELTENFIMEEIERKNPRHKGQVQQILESILIDEKVILSEDKEEIQKSKQSKGSDGIFIPDIF